MYNASTAFKTAVYKNSPLEQVLIKFNDGTILTNEDIHVSNGLKVMEAINLEEELTIGTCLSSSLEVTIMNGHRYLSDYGFGEAEVLLGVCTEQTKTSAGSELCRVVVGSNVYTGHSSTPYLRLNGSGVSSQPSFPVYSIVVDNGTVYCIGSSGSLYPNVSVPNAFMRQKLTEWAFERLGLYFSGRTLYECHADGTVEKYEFVPLGIFNITTPVKRKIDMIAVTAEDRMSRFDVLADEFLSNLTYPITLGEVYAQLCSYVGVSTITTSFINSTRSFEAAPVMTQNITARDILSWIAEAACSVARMTRDGAVELAWFTDTSVSLPMDQYFSIEVAEYTVPPIDKLQVSGSETDIGVIIGSGTNGYHIVDNPYLSGMTDEEIRSYGEPIYNRLAAFGAFSPVLAHAVCDWSIEAGDMLAIILDGETFKFPVYCQTIMWNGTARVDYESTGSDGRPVMDAENRKDMQTKRAMHELVVNVEGIKSNMTLVQDDVSKLNTRIEAIPGEILTEIEGQYVTDSELSTATSTTLNSAKSYADSAISELSSDISTTYQTKKASSTAHANTLASAKSYTNSSISSLKSTISTTYQTKSAASTANANTLASAKSYTDGAVSSLEDDISSTYQTKKASSSAHAATLQSAETYADKAITTLKAEISSTYETQESASQAYNDAISTAESYADEAIATALENLGTDFVTAETLSTAISNSETTIKSYTDGAITTAKQEMAATYETKENASTAYNEAVSTAESYTDSAIATAKQEMSSTYETKESAAAAYNEAVSTAKSYTDGAISTFSQEVSANYVKGEKGYYSSSAIIQKASADAQEVIGLLELSVTNGDESSTIKLMNGTTELSSKEIKINGMVTFTDLSTSGSTKINGSNITTGQIKSSNYSYSSGNYSTAGTMINLSNGQIRSKNFAVDSSGNAYFKGNVDASTITGGTITGAEIKTASTGHYFSISGSRIATMEDTYRHGVTLEGASNPWLQFYVKGNARMQLQQMSTRFCFNGLAYGVEEVWLDTDVQMITNGTTVRNYRGYPAFVENGADDGSLLVFTHQPENNAIMVTKKANAGSSAAYLGLIYYTTV